MIKYLMLLTGLALAYRWFRRWALEPTPHPFESFDTLGHLLDTLLERGRNGGLMFVAAQMAAEEQFVQFVGFPEGGGGIRLAFPVVDWSRELFPSVRESLVASGFHPILQTEAGVQFLLVNLSDVDSALRAAEATLLALNLNPSDSSPLVAWFENIPPQAPSIR